MRRTQATWLPAATLTAWACTVGAVASGATAAAAARTPPQAKPTAAGPAAVPGPSFDQLARKAAAAKEASRIDEAIEAYRQALKLKPSWTEGRFTLATLLYDQENYEEARNEFRRVAQENPKNGLVLALKGLCEFQLKDYSRALKDLVDARGLGIASAEVWSAASFTAAAIYNRAEQFESAFDLLREFALKDKDSQSIIELFGLSVLRMPFLPSEAPPDRREMVLMAGRAAFHQAKQRGGALARQFFEELVSRYPTAPNVHYAFGVALVPDDPAAALEEFRRELRSSPNHHQAMLQIAFELLKQGRFEEALPLAEKAAELAPNLFVSHHALGRALLETGDTDRAIVECETAAKLAPDSPEVMFALARAYAKKGRTEDAGRARETFLKLDAARRTARTGAQSVGGKPLEQEEATPSASPPGKN